MMRLEQYQKIAEEFGVNVGVAEWDEPFYPQYKKVKDIPDELRIVALTNFIIEEGIYPEVHRELFRLRQKVGKRRIKETTLYQRAIDNVWDNYKNG